MSSINNLLIEGRGKLPNGLRDKWAAGGRLGGFWAPNAARLAWWGGRLGRFWANVAKAPWRFG